MKKRLPYIIILILLIAVEVIIALTQHGNWLRYYGGDVIVVWAVYCLVQAIIGGKNPYITHIGVMLFAFLVEFLQYIHIVDIIGLGDIEFFRTLIGTSFAAEDLFCYALGTAIGIAGSFIYSQVKKIRINAKENE
ncbi:MAG: DUF2809 domain-containing protein [Ruminococcus sp.]|nr:DUF2809 domain-containing protein [Ruminococcus sp.]